MSLPPIPATRVIPALGSAIQDLLRDPPPVMIFDMGLGSREQSLPAGDPKQAPVTARTSD